MPDHSDSGRLTTERVGGTLNIGLNGVDMPDETRVALYREQVFQLLEQHPDCQRLVFDVTSVKALPSAMLGLLATVKKRGRDVEVHNPSELVQAALRVTKLDKFVTLTFDRAGDP